MKIGAKSSREIFDINFCHQSLATNIAFSVCPSLLQLQNSKVHFIGHDQMKIVLTILSSMIIFGFVYPEILPQYRYIMNPQMDFRAIFLVSDPNKPKSAQEGLI